MPQNTVVVEVGDTVAVEAGVDLFIDLLQR
jgi:hypothetical protein